MSHPSICSWESARTVAYLRYYVVKISISIPIYLFSDYCKLILPCEFYVDEYWSQHPELHDIPIYYASSLAKKCMAVYQTYINAMNDKIRRQIAISNPFVFQHISNLKAS